MNNKKDKNGLLLPDEKRLTHLGIILRKYSLDELPNFINIIKGDMSFVGPRPLLTQYLSLYSDKQMQRHFVKPGVTGLAQINGRNSISWEKKFEYDVDYALTINFLLDLKIIFLTFLKVLLSKGIGEKGKKTASYFRGSK